MIALNLQKFMPAFTGIRPPYVKNGRNITPIAMNPTEADIKKAIEAEQTAKAAKDVMEGYNGYAFWLGEDLVVKNIRAKMLSAMTLQGKLICLIPCLIAVCGLKILNSGCMLLRMGILPILFQQRLTEKSLTVFYHPLQRKI